MFPLLPAAAVEPARTIEAVRPVERPRTVEAEGPVEPRARIKAERTIDRAADPEAVRSKAWTAAERDGGGYFASNGFDGSESKRRSYSGRGKTKAACDGGSLRWRRFSGQEAKLSRT